MIPRQSRYNTTTWLSVKGQRCCLLTSLSDSDSNVGFQRSKAFFRRQKQALSKVVERLTNEPSILLISSDKFPTTWRYQILSSAEVRAARGNRHTENPLLTYQVRFKFVAATGGHSDQNPRRTPKPCISMYPPLCLLSMFGPECITIDYSIAI